MMETIIRHPKELRFFETQSTSRFKFLPWMQKLDVDILSQKLSKIRDLIIFLIMTQKCKNTKNEKILD